MTDHRNRIDTEPGFSLDAQILADHPEVLTQHFAVDSEAPPSLEDVPPSTDAADTFDDPPTLLECPACAHCPVCSGAHAVTATARAAWLASQTK